MNKYAGFLPRLGAFVIDKLFFLFYFLVLFFLVLEFLGNDYILVEKAILWLVFYFIFAHYFVWNLYLILLTNLFGGSLGKVVLGLRVTDENGRNLSIKRSAFRYLIGYFISRILFYLGFLYIIWDRKKRGFHDKIAGSYVVVYGKQALLRFILILMVLLMGSGFLTARCRQIIIDKSILVSVLWQVRNHVKRFENFFEKVEKVGLKEKINLENKEEFSL